MILEKKSFKLSIHCNEEKSSVSLFLCVCGICVWASVGIASEWSSQWVSQPTLTLHYALPLLSVHLSLLSLSLPCVSVSVRVFYVLHFCWFWFHIELSFGTKLEQEKGCKIFEVCLLGVQETLKIILKRNTFVLSLAFSKGKVSFFHTSFYVNVFAANRIYCVLILFWSLLYFLFEAPIKNIHNKLNQEVRYFRLQRRHCACSIAYLDINNNGRPGHIEGCCFSMLGRKGRIFSSTKLYVLWPAQ